MDENKFQFRAALVACVVYALWAYLCGWIFSLDQDNGLPFVAGLIGVPCAIGTFTTLMFDPLLKKRAVKSLLRTLLVMTYIVLGVSVFLAVIFYEGLICVAMALPFLIIFSGISVLVTRGLLKLFGPKDPDQTIVRSVAIFVPLLMLPIDGWLDNPTEHASVLTEIIIDAPAETIWDYTVEISQISPDEYIWTPSHSLIGVPRPIDARMEGEGVGAVRHLRWTHDVNFREVITGWEDGKRIEWDFEFDDDSIPNEIEAHIDVQSDYLNLARGEYELTPLDDGTTLLRLTTHYEMKTPFNAYCRWWGKLFLSDFHDGVLSVIKTRAEAA